MDNQCYPVVHCTHYRRHVNLFAPCCNRVVCCHVGHDSSRTCPTNLDRNRSRVTTVVCTSCRRAQPVARKCRYCRQQFGRYFCELCLIWSDGPAFHCSACGFCVAARASETRHCTTCNKCYPVSSRNHVCTTFDRCAACNGSLHRSRQRLLAPRCGHALHERCFVARALVSYSCPHGSCNRPMIDTVSWNEVLNTLTRTRCNVRVRVQCNACRRTGSTYFSQGVARCPYADCHSSNTVIQQPSAPAAIRSSSHR